MNQNLNSTGKKTPPLNGLAGPGGCNNLESILMEWKDQYKHPLWQKKRLEALDGAEYMCQRCYDSESQLHVHHKHYAKGRKIWEYETSELSVLCESCHGTTHAAKDALNSVISSISADGYTEIVGIVASYCNNVVGPTYANCEDELRSIDDPYSNAIGKIAAAFANLFIGVPALLEIVERIESHKKGEVLLLSINTAKVHGFNDE